MNFLFASKDIGILHSATCCFYKNELYVAFYAGKKECVEQKVIVCKVKDGKPEFFKVLEDNTGNPVLFVKNNHLFCAYSVFTKPFVNSVVKLWQTAYTKISCLTQKGKATILSTYCCPRCSPYHVTKESFLLPCYDENIKRGMFFLVTPADVIRGVVLSGPPMIQPSIFMNGGKLSALYRNFSHRGETKPVVYKNDIMFSKAQGRLLFSEFEETEIPNHNESIIGINDNENNSLVVYNALPQRQNLTLAFIENINGKLCPSKNSLKLNEDSNASYPNHCFDSENNLYVVFTSYDRSVLGNNRIAIAQISNDYKEITNLSYIDKKFVIDFL